MKQKKYNIKKSTDDPHEIENIGLLIKARRKILKKTQKELASQIGVSFQQLQKYENGKNKVSADRLDKISKALDIHIIYFFNNFTESKDEVFDYQEEQTNATTNTLNNKLNDFSIDDTDKFSELTSEEILLLENFNKIKGSESKKIVMDLLIQFAKQT